ncbi:MAG TPA: protein translocase subunit SecD [Solirubrobacteraceae bacterium]|nr:protein translocase subunit SecD [Solirubrobacteraceae bacterium]
MTERRRNILVLLLVAGLLAGSVAAIAVKKTREGLDLKGGVELVYQAKPTKFAKVDSDSIQRSLDIMRKRVDQLGVSEPEIQRSGSDQIVVSLPDVKNQARAIETVGTTAQMFFYDWEANVLGADCRPAITKQLVDPNLEASITGGQAAGEAGAGTLSEYAAVLRAAKCPARPHQQTSTGGPQYYLLNDKRKTVVKGPEPTRADLFSERAHKAPGPNESVRVVKVGTILVQAHDPNHPDPNDPKRANAWYVLNDDFALRGTDIKNPEQNFDNGPGGTGQPIVTFDFTGRGRKIWQDVTRRIAQRGTLTQQNQHFAVVLDHDLITTPYIDFKQNAAGIDGRNGSQISGGFTITTAQTLANQLKSGALPIKLELISASQVSATLGQQALHEGLIAGIVGFAIVALFLLLFYRVLGLIAVAALVIYAIYFFALIKLIPITLTLPGIAGLILTIGVAADANIVIFERVKEEIRGGRSVAAGIAQGYKRGIAAIIDANVVTFMTAFILFILATAGVKGFALVLGIGTLVSLFTAVLATQAVLGTVGRSRALRSPTALGAGGTHSQRTRLDYMGASRWFFSFSGVILVIGALAIGGKGLNFGIDFKSGTRVTSSFVKPASESSIRDVLSPLGYADAKIQRVTGNKEFKGRTAFQISTKALSGKELSQVKDALDKRFGFAREQDQTVGPTFGKTVAKSAIIAIIASLIVISAYIALRFEWKYAVPVLIALAHDLLITSGVYSLTGREVTTSTVAALLTILGYSLYDTIIVFDRVRENVPRMPRAAFSQIVNRSMSEVVVRSLATTFSTLLPIVALLAFGGETLRDFAFALLVGVLSGTYSSIFIASPVLTHWKEREHVYVARRRRIAQANGGVVPAYATAAAGAATDVAPADRKTRRRLTSPELPGEQVSQAEFREMVRDIQEESAVATREPEAAAEPEPDLSRDASPDELFIKDAPKRDKPRRSGARRNRRHGRSR